MHDQIYKKIENILSEFNIDGKVAEMGVNPRNTLLDSPILKDCEEKIGIVNMIKQKPKKYSDFTTIIENINNLSFSDNYFNCIICNAMLEHDKFFWKSLSEMIRVLKKGGLLIIGVPSYKNIKDYNIDIIQNKKKSEFLQKESSISFRIHDYPEDYYRFSEHAVKTVLFENFYNVVTEIILNPPRVIGYGIK